MSDKQTTHRVVLVEDSDRTRVRLAKAIAKNPRFDVVTAAPDLQAGAAAIKNLKPDLLVTDLGLPDGSGIDLIRLARTTLPACHIMVITIFGDERNVIGALEAGADGYLLKDASQDEIATALEELLAGGSPMSSPIARHLLKRFRRDSSGPTKGAQPESDVTLSEREIEVLKLVAKGFSFPEIAELLEVSKHTIRTYVRRMYQKLEVSSKNAAVYEAVNLGIINMD